MKPVISRRIIFAVINIFIIILVFCLSSFLGDQSFNPVVSSLFITIIFFLFEIILELQGGPLTKVRSDITKKFVEIVGLAIDDSELSDQIINKIVSPLKSTFRIGGSDDLLKTNPMINPMLHKILGEIGCSITASVQNGLGLTDYRGALKLLTKKANKIHAVSILPPAIWLEDEDNLAYLREQIKALQKKTVKEVKRIFVCPVQYLTPKNESEIVDAHHKELSPALRKKINVKLIGYDYNEFLEKKITDFVIFETNDVKGILCAEGLSNFMNKALNDNLDENAILGRWKKDPHSYTMNAVFHYSQEKVDSYDRKWEDLLATTNG